MGKQLKEGLRLNSYQKTEILLRNYLSYKEAIKEKELAIEEIQRDGTLFNGKSLLLISNQGESIIERVSRAYFSSS